MKWRKLGGEAIDIPIKDKVLQTILAESALGNQLKICVGTDSQVKGETIDFATVIVFVRKQKGGFMFVSKFSERRKMGLKERMITEVGKSIEIAYSICDVVARYNIELEVHADINTDPVFKSNVALKEAMGYILGMGFHFKAKPHAFASSSCADKVV